MGIAVVIAAGRCIIGPRFVNSHDESVYEFPGGKCEEGESHQQAALRECVEETGLVVKPLRLLQAKSHRYTVRTLQMEFWLCTPQEPVDAVFPLLTPPFFWSDLGELSRYRFFDANNELVKMLIAEPHADHFLI